MKHYKLSLLRYVCGILLLLGNSSIHADVAVPAEGSLVAVEESASQGNLAAEGGQYGKAGHSSEDQSDARPELSVAAAPTDQEEIATAAASMKSNKGLIRSLARGILITTHPGAYHSPAHITIFGEQVQLQDGSIWSIYPDERYKVLNWLPTDVVVIMPNHSWLTGSSYPYRLVNQNTGVSAIATLDLFLVPAYHSLYNHIIVAYDDANQMICLEDGSTWKVTFWDYSTRWKIGHTIIIGVNDGSASSSYPNILINADRLEYVRATCLN